MPVNENYVVGTLSFLQYYIKMISSSVKNENECGIYEKNLKNSNNILRLYC